MANQIIRLKGMPEATEPNCIYFINTHDEWHPVSMYVTDKNNRMYTLFDISEMRDEIDRSTYPFSKTEVIPNLNYRETMNWEHSTLVLVQNNTDKPDEEEKGQMLYMFYKPYNTWYPLSKGPEAETLWESISGRPTSSVADIDDAVAKRHEHTNSEVLKNLEEGAEEQLKYKGKNITNVRLVYADF